jgi:hypothetical protein
MATGELEQVFVRALMVLGKAPPMKTMKEAQESNVDSYIAWMGYLGECDKYFYTQKGHATYPLEGWTRAFLEWQGLKFNGKNPDVGGPLLSRRA